MFPVLALNLIPTALITLAWLSYLRRKTILPKSRSILFVCGLITGTLASILLIIFLVVTFLDPSRVGHVNASGGIILVTAFLMAVISAPLALTGRNAERIFAMACGLSLILLLYMAGMASSI